MTSIIIFHQLVRIKMTEFMGNNREYIRASLSDVKIDWAIWIPENEKEWDFKLLIFIGCNPL